MDTSTLLIVLLLVSAATLASYALSHWSSSRGAGGSVGWAATSIGTTMLLTAAAIAVLAFVFRGLLWPSHSEAEPELIESAGSTNTRSPFGVAAAETPPSATAPSSAPADQTARVSGNRHLSQATSPPQRGSKQSITSSPRQTAEHDQTARNSTPLPTFSELSPWAAMLCVHLFNPDLSEPTRWKVENGCDVPVGVILSSCVGSSTECNDPASTSWKYPSHDTIFPAQLQRPITLEEQTVRAREVRYVACFVSTPLAVQLIGAPSDERSSASWREQFEAVRESDACLMRVKSWSAEGRRTRMPIDVLLGVSSAR